MAERSPKGLKTLWGKEKLLVTSNFSISCSVFKRLLQETHKNQDLFGKGSNLNPYSIIKTYWCHCSQCRSKITLQILCNLTFDFYLLHFDPLPNNNFFRLVQKIIFFLKRIESIFWEKEKIMVFSIFSLFHNVFKSFLSQGG